CERRDGAPAHDLRRPRSRPRGRLAVARRRVRPARRSVLLVATQRRRRALPERGPQPERLHHMDRLSPVSSLSLRLSAGLLIVAAMGCGDDGADATPPVASGRFEGVAAEPTGIDAVLADVCDAHRGAEDAPRFSFPETAGEVALQEGSWT